MCIHLSKRVVILGGGISGLAAAYTLANAEGSPYSITVVEQNSDVGGLLRTSTLFAVDNVAHEILRFVFDTGLHIFRFMDNIDVLAPFTDLIEVRKNTYVYTGFGYKKIDSSGNYYYPDNKGSISLVHDLLDDRVSYLLGEKPTNIDFDSKKVYLKDKVLDYDILISSIPLSEFVGFSDDLNIYSKELRGRDGVILNLGVKYNDLHYDKTMLYYVDEEIPFDRVGFYSSLSDISAPEGYSACCVEIYDADSYDYNTVVEWLIAVGVLENESDIVVKEEILIKNIDIYVNSLTTKIQNSFEEQGVYLIGRGGNWAMSTVYGSMQEALHVEDKIHYTKLYKKQ